MSLFEYPVINDEAYTTLFASQAASTRAARLCRFAQREMGAGHLLSLVGDRAGIHTQREEKVARGIVERTIQYNPIAAEFVNKVGQVSCVYLHLEERFRQRTHHTVVKGHPGAGLKEAYRTAGRAAVRVDTVPLARPDDAQPLFERDYIDLCAALLGGSLQSYERQEEAITFLDVMNTDWEPGPTKGPTHQQLVEDQTEYISWLMAGAKALNMPPALIPEVLRPPEPNA